MNAHDFQTVMAALTRCGVYKMRDLPTVVKILAGKVNKVCADNDLLRAVDAERKYLVDVLIEENAKLNQENKRLTQGIKSACESSNSRQAQ